MKFQTLSGALLAFAAIVTTTIPSLTLAQVKDIDDAVLKSARQGMLVQRIGKAYMALALKVEDPLAKKILSDSVAQFDRHLVELKVFAPTPELKSVYAQLDAPWTSFKEVAIGTTPTQTSAKRLLVLEGALLKGALDASQQLQRRSNVPTTQLIASAEYDAVYSQRAAMYYLATLVDSTGTGNNGELDKARADFVRNMQNLKNTKRMPEPVARKVQLAESQWAFLEKAVANRGDARNRVQLAGNVLKSSERVLEVVEDIAVSLQKL
ncbi:MAG: hypothetical protein ACRDAM_20450 [Casimicrobium sp.]